jgi:hypothetical protein
MMQRKRGNDMATSESSGVAWVLPKQNRWGFADTGLGSLPSIATENSPKVHPAWGECENSLLDALIACQSRDNRNEDAPSYESITAALSWLVYLRRQMPETPPTFISTHPDGGILIERRWVEDGDSIIWQIELLNDGGAEATVFYNGKVVDCFTTMRCPH